MSYVAERRGGGPHDLLGGFDSFRNCTLNFLWQQWLDLRVVFPHYPFFFYFYPMTRYALSLREYALAASSILPPKRLARQPPIKKSPKSGLHNYMRNIFISLACLSSLL